MLAMLLKMSGMTAIYVVTTVILWKYLKGRQLTHLHRYLAGVVFGLLSVMSTHFGVNYISMMLNVRDIGPLAAGLFFDPISGVIAGLIGGIERYIAGTYWGVGSYTRIACSVSTCLAGFVAALMHLLIFKRKKPSAIYAFFMGMVMEVFHMYVVLITHRNDMDMALHVVKICAPPMIIFTGIGLAASSVALQVLSGEWRNPLRHVPKEEVPVSQRFQFWLFAVTSSILLLIFTFSFVVQTKSARQDARNTLKNTADDIADTYVSITKTQDGINNLTESMVLSSASAIAKTLIENGTDPTTVDESFLEDMRSIYNLASLTVADLNGTPIRGAGNNLIYFSVLSDVLSGKAQQVSAQPNSASIVAGARCGDTVIQAVADPNALAARLSISGLNDALSFFHVGSTGTFDIIQKTGLVTAGSHQYQILSDDDFLTLKDGPEGVCFTAGMFRIDSLCYKQSLSEDVFLMTCLPMEEVYSNRDAQAYETALADILLFTVIYMLISILVQQIVVNNLQMVNESLGRITNGDLNEVVSVRDSSEFASLSNDINQTVSVLKGYISAAEKRIEQELEFARAIQESALPRNFAFPRHDFEIFATMDPAKEVGGDFYDFFFVGVNRLALVIADVSGKGIPAAMFMMRAKTAIRGMAESGSAPAEIFYKANNILCEGNDAEMFVTAWIGIIDLTTGAMQCANAGHEYPVLMRSGGDYELIHDKHGLALAAMEEMRFKEYSLQLNPGDRLFVYTDGIPEAIDDNVEQYGAERMVAVLNTLKTAPMDQTLPAVRQDIRDFVGSTDQFDDITMLGFIYTGKR